MNRLNEKFGIPDRITIGAGKNGLARADLHDDAGDSAELYLQGAHVTSWRHESEQCLFLSAGSRFEQDQPIRGGIPLVFPQFGGRGNLPQHGFARNRLWSIQSTGVTETGAPEIVLALQDGEASRALWGHAFELTFTVRLDSSLSTELRVANTGSRSFSFTAALHTYFAVSDIESTYIAGLQGIEYTDSLRDGQSFSEQREKIIFKEEVDRVYSSAPDTLYVVEEGRRRFRIEKSGFGDAVAWNPWIAKSKRMPDFGDDEYRNMVCLEAGAIVKPVVLQPGQNWNAVQKLSVETV